MNFLRIASALLLWPLPAAVPGIGSATFLEGSLRLLRGTSVLQGAEGLRISKATSFETSDKGFVQLEFTGGTVVALALPAVCISSRQGEGHLAGKAGSQIAESLFCWAVG